MRYGYGWTTAAINADLDERAAYIENAKYDLEEVRSLIHDNFPSPMDLWIKHEFLQAVENVQHSLEKALL